ncbi:oxidoreductase, short chain dehydrogenase/reductase family protein [Trichuris suis]|nr:oxidoreductase, short chain dehydrogenase/reductase family protein [Trichuris suis]
MVTNRVTIITLGSGCCRLSLVVHESLRQSRYCYRLTISIPGASSGIGRGIAKAFSSAGYNLIICGRNAEALNETVDLCLSEAKEKGEVIPFVGDLTVTGTCQRVIDEAVSKFSRIDVVIFCNSSDPLGVCSIEREQRLSVPLDCHSFRSLRQNSKGTFASEAERRTGRTVSYEYVICVLGPKLLPSQVNNAGMLIPGSALSDLKVEDFNTLMKNNVQSAVDLSLCALSHLLKTKGCVVNISSICGRRPMPNRVFYSMSKAAMDMFTKAMALDLAPHGVRFNSVNPGLIPTQIHVRTGDPTMANVTQYYEDCRPKIPAMRLGTIEEVADSVLFLASDKASYITGQLLGIDGGLSL